MVWAKSIYILMIKVNSFFSYFFIMVFIKEIENMHMFPMFLLRYRDIREKSCGNTCLQLLFPRHFSFFQTSTHVSTTWLKHGMFFLFLKCVSRGFFWVILIWHGVCQFLHCGIEYILGILSMKWVHVSFRRATGWKRGMIEFWVQFWNSLGKFPNCGLKRGSRVARSFLQITAQFFLVATLPP